MIQINERKSSCNLLTVEQKIFTAVNFHYFRVKAMFTAGIFHALLVFTIYLKVQCM
jgi:hypothetical protein